MRCLVKRRAGPFAGIAFVILLSIGGCAPRAPQPAPAVGVDEQLSVGGETIVLHVSDDSYHVSREQIRAWVLAAGQAAAEYLGHFPVKKIDLFVQMRHGEGNSIDGEEFGGIRISVALAANTSASDLRDDWVLTHEMFHLAFPQMPDDRLWAGEGLSTFLEPIARARHGMLKTDDMWLGIVQGMPDGLPTPGDQGLNNTHTWGRTYWGGAMFWLLADMRIREQTHGQRTLADAIRGILAAGGTGAADWELQQALDVGDHATGTHVLNELHDELARKPGKPDLDALWNKLGIHVSGNQITFDDTAPDAAIRRAMTMP